MKELQEKVKAILSEIENNFKDEKRIWQKNRSM